MKLVRYGKSGKEKPGLIDADGKLRDLSGVIKDIGPEQLRDAALYLKKGDVMTLGVEGLGEQRQRVVPFTR